MDAFKTGIRRGKEVNIIVQKSSYMNEELFINYITTQFIPHVFILRLQHMRYNQRAILFMDNLRSHCSERILQELGRKNILAISFPPHTSHLFQMLDLPTFGLMKSKLKETHLLAKLHPSADHLVRTLQSLKHACISSSVRAAFQKAGFDIVMEGEDPKLSFNSEKIQNSDDFKELWDIDYPESSLSARKKATKWGLLNLEYLQDIPE
jgi:hypothetical protein